MLQMPRSAGARHQVAAARRLKVVDEPRRNSRHGFWRHGSDGKRHDSGACLLDAIRVGPLAEVARVVGIVVWTLLSTPKLPFGRTGASSCVYFCA